MLRILFLSLVLLTSCQNQDSHKPLLAAKAILSPTEGNQTKGVVFFTQTPEGVEIIADFENLNPGKHGFHIHEFGDCSALDATSAGGHFNPTNQKHGGPDDQERHHGDLGNVEADNEGRAHYERVDTVIQLEGEYSIIGKSVIIHENEDDFVSQPTGDAGKRVSCGLILED